MGVINTAEVHVAPAAAGFGLVEIEHGFAELVLAFYPFELGDGWQPLRKHSERSGWPSILSGRRPRFFVNSGRPNKKTCPNNVDSPIHFVRFAHSVAATRP